MKSEKLIRIGLVLILIIGCFTTRTINVTQVVFPNSEEVRLFGVDPYFYLREAEITVKNYPRLAKVDHGTHYPTGTYSDLAGFYTLFSATVIKIVDVFIDHDQIEAAVLAYIPVVIGCVAVLLLFLIGSTLFTYWHGFAMGLLYIFFPGLSLPRSVLGFSDHHVLEFVLGLGIIYGLIKLIKNKYSILNSFYASIPVVLFFMSWNGSPLYIILIAFTILYFNTVILFHNYKIDNYAKRWLSYCLMVSGVTLFFHLVWSDLLVLFDDRITVQAIIVLGVLGVLAPLQLYAGKYLKKYYHNSKVIAIGILGLGLGLSYLIFQNTNIGIRAIQMMNMQATNLVENAAIDYKRFFHINEIAGYFGILGIFCSAIIGFLKKESRIMALLPVFSGFFIWMWLNTFDMGYMVSPFMCLMSIVGVSIIINYFEKYLSPKILPYSKYFVLLAAVLMVASKFLFTSNYQFYFTENSVRQGTIYQEGWYAAADWLKVNTPELDNPIHKILPEEAWQKRDISYGAGDYGIICAWDFGNIINQRAQRIPVWSRWPAPRVPKWLMSQSEEESLKNLCPNCEEQERIKYAVVDAKTAGTYFSSKAKTAGYQVVANNTQRETSYGGRNITLFTFGSLFDNSIINRLYALEGNNLSHYRLVWDSPQMGFTSYISSGPNFERYDRELKTSEEMAYFSQDLETLGDGTGQNVFYQGYMGPWVKVYEIVRGAEIDGTYLPNAQLKIELKLRSNSSNREIDYYKYLRCDENGHFTSKLPYATNMDGNSAISNIGSYRMLHGEQEISMFDVSNEDVVSGTKKVISFQ